jgi:hypothetical protein
MFNRLLVAHPRYFSPTLRSLRREGHRRLLRGAGDTGATAATLAQRGHLKSQESV